LGKGIRMTHTTQSAKKIHGTITVPADKSISHRSLLFAALAMGTSTIKNLLLSEDVLRTLTILRQLGVKTSHDANSLKAEDTLVVEGVGLNGFKAPKEVLYCGNSGTTMRLMLGLLAGQPFESALTGDESLNRRPMERVTKPLEQMGASFREEERDGNRHIHVVGNPSLTAIDYQSPVASAQVKSAILLASLWAEGMTTVSEPTRSRNHTEIMLKAMGLALTVQGNGVSVTPGNQLQPFDITVPGDISSAAFFIVAGLIVPNAELKIKNVGLNPTRTGIVDVLKEMNASLDVENRVEVAGESVGTINVKTSNLVNTVIGGDVIPRLIDEIPILALAGTMAKGSMLVKDAGELRVKESDRIQAVCQELGKLGISLIEKEDGFSLEGKEGILEIAQGLKLKSYGDHRMALMEIIAGLIASESFEIDDVACMSTSFPGFFDLLRSVT
jgi:3-phosphoshikimate 1-carboxyvinyltransferase